MILNDYFDENQARKDIVEIGKRLYSRGYIVASEGNLSIRLNDTELLASPRGLCKGYLTTNQIVKTDLKGNKLSGSSEYFPSTEIRMHLA